MRFKAADVDVAIFLKINAVVGNFGKVDILISVFRFIPFSILSNIALPA